MQWSEILADTSLQDLPYKIELNDDGHIIRSPASNKHGWYQSKLVQLLSSQLKEGEIITKCSIQTEEGVKVADVVWCSPQFLGDQNLEETPFTQAPEICIEIISPSNSLESMLKKVQLYLKQGAYEVWLVDLNNKVQFFDKSGKKPSSSFLINLKIT